jgi:hypothetical protein
MKGVGFCIPHITHSSGPKGRRFLFFGFSGMSSRGRFPPVILDNPLLVSRLSLCSIFLYAWNLVQYVVHDHTVWKDLPLLPYSLFSHVLAGNSSKFSISGASNTDDLRAEFCHSLSCLHSRLEPPRRKLFSWTSQFYLCREKFISR